jgi:hypothetical protein
MSRRIDRKRKETLAAAEKFTGAPTIIAGRDVVHKVPDRFGGVDLRPVGAGAAQEQRT